MTDRPILFSAPLIRALIAGRKTQTRRNLSIRGHKGFFQFGASDTPGYDWTFRRKDHVWEDYSNDDLLKHLPYQVGDRLWVRETWSDVNTCGAPGIAYKANGDITDLMERDDFLNRDGAFNYEDPRLKFGKKKEALPFANWHHDLLSGTEGTWRSPIFMPRWASRLMLTVTEVRVQRLQDITQEDAEAEGCHGWLSFDREDGERPEEEFQDVWNNIHGPASWDANPYVVAITFDFHKCNIDMMEGAV